MRRCLPGWIGSPASMDLRHAADRHTGAAGTAKEKVYKLRDECGLLLMVRPTGAKWWRLRYRFQGPGKMISLGSCPDVTLSMRGTAATVYEIGCATPSVLPLLQSRCAPDVRFVCADESPTLAASRRDQVARIAGAREARSVLINWDRDVALRNVSVALLANCPSRARSRQVSAVRRRASRPE